MDHSSRHELTYDHRDLIECHTHYYIQVDYGLQPSENNLFKIMSSAIT